MVRREKGGTIIKKKGGKGKGREGQGEEEREGRIRKGSERGRDVLTIFRGATMAYHGIARKQFQGYCGIKNSKMRNRRHLF